jgi:hypothetical protein
MLDCYIDMDGVIAQYDRSAYTGPNPRWLDPDAHYFAHVKPDDKMVDVVVKLTNMLADRSRNNIHITSCHFLSSLAKQGSIMTVQYKDKCEWLDNCVGIHMSSLLIPSLTGKRHTVESRYDGKLSAKDVLIDDFNQNLLEWQKAGGTAIKYLNGQNDKDSFDGVVIDETMTSDDIIDMLRLIDKALQHQYMGRK